MNKRDLSPNEEASLTVHITRGSSSASGRTPRSQDFAPLADTKDFVIGDWDIFEDNAYEAACRANVLERGLIDQLKEPLSAVQSMKAVLDNNYLRRLHGPNVKQAGSKTEKAELLMRDIEDFWKKKQCSHLVIIWCGSTELFRKPAAIHQPLKDFEQGLENNDPDISLTQIYVYAALKLDVPSVNGAPPPYDRRARPGGAGRKQTRCGLRQRLQDWANVHEKPDRAGFESAPAWRVCPVFDQHTWQPAMARSCLTPSLSRARKKPSSSCSIGSSSQSRIPCSRSVPCRPNQLLPAP
jgi:hypothetical protein